MNSHFLHELSMAAEVHGVYAEDMADRLSSKYTSVGLLALAAVTVMRQYVFKPIHCWVPANWPRPWEEFAENYCWTQGTYRVSLREPGHPAVQARGETAINYYQWVPILLLAQAVLVLAPHQLWCMAARQFSGRDPNAVVRFAREVERAGHPAAKQRLLAYTAWQLSLGPPRPPTALATAGHRNGSGRRERLQCSAGVGAAMRRSGWVLFAVYIASKVAYLLSAVGQIFILQSYLGFSSFLFGWHCARQLLSGGSWESTGIFPRVTFCDVPLRHVGQWNLHSVQCVLALNMINEKIFIFLWFWFAFCFLATAAYTICWLVQTLPASGRRSIVKNLLRLLATKQQQQQRCQRLHRAPPTVDDVDDSEDDEAARIARQLRPDGLFLLQMIADNTDCVSAAHVLHRLVAEHEDDDDDDGAAAVEEDDADDDVVDEDKPPPYQRHVPKSAELPLKRAVTVAAVPAAAMRHPPRMPFGPASHV